MQQHAVLGFSTPQATVQDQTNMLSMTHMSSKGALSSEATTSTPATAGTHCEQRIEVCKISLKLNRQMLLYQTEGCLVGPFLLERFFGRLRTLVHAREYGSQEPLFALTVPALLPSSRKNGVALQLAPVSSQHLLH
jgi:hypothetical protein